LATTTAVELALFDRLFGGAAPTIPIERRMGVGSFAYLAIRSRWHFWWRRWFGFSGQDGRSRPAR